MRWGAGDWSWGSCVTRKCSCGWWGGAGWILGCSGVRNLVYEVSVTQFQCARGHDRNKAATWLKLDPKKTTKSVIVTIQSLRCLVSLLKHYLNTSLLPPAVNSTHDVSYMERTSLQSVFVTCSRTMTTAPDTHWITKRFSVGILKFGDFMSRRYQFFSVMAHSVTQSAKWLGYRIGFQCHWLLSGKQVSLSTDQNCLNMQQ